MPRRRSWRTFGVTLGMRGAHFLVRTLRISVDFGSELLEAASDARQPAADDFGDPLEVLHHGVTDSRSCVSGRARHCGQRALAGGLCWACDVLSVSAAKCARGLPRLAREYPREVTLIGKSNAERHLGERPICVADQVRGGCNAALQKVTVRRHADTLLERAGEVPGGKAGDARKFGQADLVRELSLDVLAGATQASERHTTARSVVGGRRNRLPLLHQLAYSIEESLGRGFQ